MTQLLLPGMPDYPGFMYWARDANREATWIKVGWTSDPMTRRRSLMKGPNGVIMLAVWVADKDEEERFHDVHKVDRVRNDAGHKESYWPTELVVSDLLGLTEDADRLQELWIAPDLSRSRDRMWDVLFDHQTRYDQQRDQRGEGPALRAME